MVSSATAEQYDKNYQSRLKPWILNHLLEQSILPQDQEDFSWQALNGDAGFRRYFRLQDLPANLLAVYAPPATENNQGFFDIGQFLLKHGVHTPKILAVDISEGFFLIEDLGCDMYLDKLTPDNASVMYGEALFSLLRIQQCPLDKQIFPLYDAERLQAEMALFPEWFVTQMLGHELDENEHALMQECFQLLTSSAIEQAQVVVHRDYHSRNIVYGLGGSPGIIDYQDAVIGPVTYDLVSLLRDCYIRWPEEQVRSWALAYGNMALDAGIIPPTSEDVFMRWFDWMGLQRHIKVLGIFARLSLRDNKHAYLNDLPLVVSYVREVLPRYPEFAQFREWFEAVIMPKVNEQSWMPS